MLKPQAREKFLSRSVVKPSFLLHAQYSSITIASQGSRVDSMYLNEHTALVTSHILLVPYSEHHVPQYHEWMQDEDLQALTASEPLSIEEEYEMQQSWRKDNDKLTFIACLPPTPSPASSSPIPQPISAKSEDSNDKMIGDINLFLFDDDDDEDDNDNEEENQSAAPAKTPTPKETNIIGEIELMIAAKSLHRKGYGRAALLAFMGYIYQHLDAILAEYTSSDTSSPLSGEARLKYLRVKINKENIGSVRLFETVGFVRTSSEPNYFGEVELRLGGEGVEWVQEGLKKLNGWEDVRVIEYEG